MPGIAHPRRALARALALIAAAASALVLLAASPAPGRGQTAAGIANINDFLDLPAHRPAIGVIGGAPHAW